MQQHINVYAETMNEKIPSRMLPLSKMSDIKDAMSFVQETDDLYRDETGKLKVDSEWHQAAVLDFGDWLAAHIPDFSEALLCYNLGTLPIIQDWMRYTAVERTSEIDEAISDIWEMEPPTSSELAQAHIVADLLLQHEGALTLNVFGDVNGIENVYVPNVVPSIGLEELSEMDIEDLESLDTDRDEYWTYLSELIVIALTCIKSDVAVLSYTAHLKEANAFGMFLFADGHVTNMPREYYPSLIDAKLEDESMFANHLMEFSPRSNFELSSARMASAVVMGMQSQMQNAYEKGTGRPFGSQDNDETDVDIKLTLVDNSGILLQENVMGEYAAAPAPLSIEHDTLVDLFQACIDASPFVTPEEATDFIVSTCVAHAACELLLTGSTNGMNELICDMFQALDFGLADIELVPSNAALIEEQEEMLTTYKELEINEEVFASLPQEQQSEVDWLLANIELDPDSNRTVLAVEGELDEDEPAGGSVVKATSIRVPSAHSLPMEAEKETSRLLRQMCIQAFRSPSTTMFITSRGETPNRVSLSAVQWKNGHWEDISEDKAMFYIMATSLGQQLDIFPGDDIDYRRFRG